MPLALSMCCNFNIEILFRQTKQTVELYFTKNIEVPKLTFLFYRKVFLLRLAAWTHTLRAAMFILTI